MTSAIDSTKPTTGTALTSDVRANFATAASEISALQEADIFTQSGAGAVATDLQTRGRQVVYVTDFAANGVSGAKVDPTGVVDSTLGIQAAIDSVTTNAEIVFPKGTYKVGAAGMNMTSKTTVRLISQGAKVTASALATQTSLIGGKCVIKFLTCTDCSISGFYLDGGSFAHDLVSLNTCTDCTVENNIATLSGVHGVLNSYGGTRSTFRNNVVKSPITPAGCIRLGHYNNASEIDTDGAILGNRIDCGGVVSDGIVLGCMVGGIVNGNVQANGYSGIIISGANGRCSKRIAISGNKFSSNSAHGIQYDVVYTTDADVPTDLSITGNVCTDNGGAGIYVLRFFNSVINGNVCLDNGVTTTNSGIDISGGSGLTIDGNVCRDSRAGGSRTQNSGITVTGDSGITGQTATDDVVITGNYCDNHTSHGIVVQTAATGTCNSVIVSGNVCNDNATDGIVCVEASAGQITRLVVNGNVCASNGTADLRVDPLDAVIDGNLWATRAGFPLFQFTNADATPSVLGDRRSFKCANSGGTTITAFDDGVFGQVIEIWFSTANTTINNGGNFLLKGGLNLAPIAANSFLRFQQTGTNFWTEISRNF